MDLWAYVAAVEEFGPALTELGFELGDFSETVPAIYVSGHGISTYVRMDDREQLEALCRSREPTTPRPEEARTVD